MDSAEISLKTSLLLKSCPTKGMPNAQDGSIVENKVGGDEWHSGDTSVFKQRPTNLKDLSYQENLTCDTTEANFTLDEVSESEEIWVFDFPKSIDPKNFKGQTIKLGNKNSFQIGEKLYETISSTSHNNQNLSFVFNTGTRKRPYKTVNLNPVGSVRIRQKLSRVLDVDLVSSGKTTSVPFPKNLKHRHPLFGCSYNEK